jgi:hypothetical protein
METTNLISTPNIEGNIGSCTSNEVTYISGRDGFWTVNKTTTVTNSCTGEVNSYEYWAFSDCGGGILAAVVTVGLFVLIGWITD